MISFFCSHDFLQIKRKVNQRSVLLTTICGQKTNYQVPISGDFVLLRFHTDNKNEQRGFDIDFMFLQDGKKTENSKTGRVPQIVNDKQLRPLILPSFQSLGTKPDNEEGLMGLQACPPLFFFFFEQHFIYYLFFLILHNNEKIKSVLRSCFISTNCPLVN